MAEPLTKDKIYLDGSCPSIELHDLKSALEYYRESILKEADIMHGTAFAKGLTETEYLLKLAFPAIYENAEGTKRLKSERDEISRSNEIKYEK